MTVAELIAALEVYRGDMPVRIETPDGRITGIDVDGVWVHEETYLKLMHV